MKFKLLSIVTISVLLTGCISSTNKPTVDRCTKKAQTWAKSDIKSTQRLAGNMYNGAIDIAK